jgi:C-terminal processing protease CtpA/Prc
LRLTLKGEKDDGSEYFKTVMLKVGNEPTGVEKLRGLGITTRDEDGKVIVDMVGFSSAAEKARIDFDQEIVNIQLVADRPNKEWMFIPALLLLVLVWILQRRRAAKILLPAGV